MPEHWQSCFDVQTKRCVCPIENPKPALKLHLFYSRAESIPQTQADWTDGGICEPTPEGEGPAWGWGLSLKGGDYVFDMRCWAPWTFMKLVPVDG